MALSNHTPIRRPATLEDFLAIPPDDRFHEILDGELVLKAMPSIQHGHAQAKLASFLDPYSEGAVPGAAGTWWIATEVEVLLSPGRQPVRPDLSAWTCLRMPEMPDGFPVELLPDWVCEVVSKDDPRRDTVVKRRDYAQAGIPHYWLLDLRTDMITTLHLKAGVYVVAHEARRGETLAAAPFEQVKIPIDMIFGRAAKRH
jgi:Uma2 family endonuclease